MFFCILSALSAAAYGLHFVHRPESYARTICKALAVGTLTLAATLSHAPVLLICALALGTLGDVFLAGRGQARFIAGLIAFLIGHLAYVIVLAGFSLGASALWTVPWRLICAIALIGCATFITTRLWQHLGALRAPVLIYIVVILAMGLTALTLPHIRWLALAIIGAAMFIASDAILGFELFTPKTDTTAPKWPATLLWALYWGGQSLIFAGIILSR